MDISFELASSMSPKINHKTVVNRVRRAPTALALKKFLRRSSSKFNKSLKLNESIITIESSSASSASSNKNEKSVKNMDRLSREKYTNIKLWVDEVNKNAQQDDSVFSQVSTIYGDDNPNFKQPSTNNAANSTLVKTDSKRFDEFFVTKRNHNKKKNYREIASSQFSDDADVVNDSLLTEDNSLEEKCKNLVLEDSFELNLDESLHSRIHKKVSGDKVKSRINRDIKSSEENLKNEETDNLDEYEALLDSLYGTSWREKKEEILPSSEPRKKQKNKQPIEKIPKSEKPNNLLKTLQKERFKRALVSPWTNSLKNICDSDSDTESNTKLPPTRLNFDLNEQKAPTYSFLASLSGNVPISKCDFTALIFRNNFKTNREELVKRLFKLYNEKIFDDAIPKDTPLEWNDRMRGTAGFCYCRKITRRTGAIERAARIVLATKVLDSPDRIRDTLVHEMCHAATWIVNQVADGHGALWQAWAQRAMEVFPELPPIKRCHQYVINTKYTYRCTKCGYSIGRHTKSLDIDKKRCGHCYGQFEVLINKTSKKGETKTVLATPKKASGFALFVKENYANCKEPSLTHAEVMKLLGQKFADFKVDKS